MISPAIELPKQDQYTTYDYDIGASRVSAVDSNQYNIKYLNTDEQFASFVEILNNPLNSELREVFERGAIKRSSLYPKLQVTYKKNDSCEYDEVNALTKDKTREFAKKSFLQWGVNSEKVLSSSSSGALYWNIIHHFGDFNRFRLGLNE